MNTNSDSCFPLPDANSTPDCARRPQKTVAIIQARMGSSRLPGKVLHEIAGEPMLAHIARRARLARRVDHVLIATSTDYKDDAIADYCNANRLDCFRGSPGDVLDRYYQAALSSQADIIVRLTADCPLHDSGVIDGVAAAFQSGAFDYVSNVAPPTYPDGLDTEVFSFDALNRAWLHATLSSEREHVTPYMRTAGSGLQTANVAHAADLSGLRWTVDEPSDLAFARTVFHALGTNDFTMSDVVVLLRHHPHLQQINARHFRNEGYLLSLQNECVAA